MEKSGKTAETCMDRSNFVIKLLLLALCLIVAAQFVLFATNFASLKALNNRLNAMEEEQILDSGSLRKEKREGGTRRSKRGIDETEFNRAMVKLQKLEGR
jgi:biopolymer transport protein ExbB/TolQ